MDLDNLPSRFPTFPSFWNTDAEVVLGQLEASLACFPMKDGEILRSARDFASERHLGQYRKGGEPYIIHPTRVTLSLIIEFRVRDVELLTASLLHDLLEDTHISEQTLRSEFGDAVTQIVRAVTRERHEDRPESGDHVDSSFFKRLRVSGDKALLLKLADKLDNLRDALSHPLRKKRTAYVTETPSVYMPLIKLITDSKTRRVLRSAMLDAIRAHDPDSLLRLLEARADVTKAGATVDVPVACLDEALDRFLLTNPRLRYWINFDDNRAVRVDLSPPEIVSSVAGVIAAYIRRGDTARVLEVFGLPIELSSPRNEAYWIRAAEQLDEIQRLVRRPSSLRFLAGARSAKNHSFWLVLIHAVILKPANWLFPMWHGEYGAQLIETIGSPWYGSDSEVRGAAVQGRFLSFLLDEREALWRFGTGVGGENHVKRLQDAAKGVTTVERRVLWTFRLLTEYLDVVTNPDYDFESQAVDPPFDTVWRAIESCKFTPPMSRQVRVAMTAAHPDLCQHEIWRGVDVLGAERTRAVFERHSCGDDFRGLAETLIKSCRGDTGHRMTLQFDAAEFEKRHQLFSDVSRGPFGAKMSPEALERAGIWIEKQWISTRRQVVYTVKPARRYALINRLPEVSPDDVHAIVEGRFSAMSIFDTLIASKITGRSPGSLWLPRVYRILDTLADFAPEEVQALSVQFHCADGENSNLVAYLPLTPSKAGARNQAKRKRIVARYLICQIYNYAVTKRVLGVTVDCAAVGKAHSASAFDIRELLDFLKEADGALALRNNFGRFVENFNFNLFQVRGGSKASQSVPFDKTDMCRGTYLGVDIGGTDIKVCMFRNGRAITPKGQSDLLKFSTFPSTASRATPIELKAFWRRVITRISAWMGSPTSNWPVIAGIGVSWPGAVRDGHIAGFSGVLTKLSHTGTRFEQNSPPDLIHCFPLVETLEDELRRFVVRRGIRIASLPVITVENDGNAEALGNHCYRVVHGEQTARGKIIIKLGTSLAGGRVCLDSSVADDVAEFSKIIPILGRIEKKRPAPPMTKEYVSSLGIRNLSRNYRVDEQPLFGERDGSNVEERKDLRIEAIELGQLLLFYKAVDPEEKLLAALIGSDNHLDTDKYQGLVEDIVARVRGGDLSAAFDRYIYARGREAAGRTKPTKRRGRKSRPSLAKAALWREGLSRTRWLCVGKKYGRMSIPVETVPRDFPFGAFAVKVIGTAGLFSQLGLHIAHTIAALYNVYRRGTFTEVILAGGALSGETGPVVLTQLSGFLLKYYDKIYGPGKHLPADALQLAQIPQPETIGPLGAAMVANRARKTMQLAQMRHALDLAIASVPLGNTVTRAALARAVRNAGLEIELESFEAYIAVKVASSILVPESTRRDAFRRQSNVVA